MNRPIDALLTFAEGLNATFRPEGGRGVTLEVSYVISSQMNAFSASDAKCDAIALTAGLFIRYWQAAQVFDAEEFRAIAWSNPKPSSIPVNPYRLSPTINMADIIRDWKDHKVAASQPARWLAFAMTYMILHHELAHIWLGHTLLIPFDGKLSEDYPSDIDRIVLGQTLEIAADRQAMTACFQSFVLSNELTPDFPAMGTGDMIHNLALSSALAWELMGRMSRPEPFKFQRGVHPAFYERVYFCAEALKMLSLTYTDLEEKIIEEIIDHATKVGIYAAAILTGGGIYNPDLPDLVKLMKEKFYASAMMSNLIRPNLERFKRGLNVPEIHFGRKRAHWTDHITASDG